MSKALTQIIYLSSAVKLMSNDELQALLNHSRPANEAKDISGMLIYDDGNFIQVLEGEEQRLDELLKIIHKDTRHKGVIEINREPIEKREFQE